MKLANIKKGILLLLSYPIYPISLFFPKNKRKWLFGSFGLFNDNSRYLFEYCIKNKLEINSYWVAKSKREYLYVRGKGYPVIYKYSLSGLFHLLTSKVYIYSSYVSNLCYFTSGNKLLVNLWHGIPLKKIEYDILTPPLNNHFRNASLWMKISHPQLHKRENLLLCPSDFLYENIFSSAFRKTQNDIIYANYPRVTYLDKNKLLKNNSDDFTITYTPTWRDSNPGFLNEKKDLLFKINKLAKEKNFNFNIKPHSNTVLNKELFSTFEKIKIIDNNIDPLEILLETDCLITDYSSIYLDFLFLNRPIVFFQYDKSSYLENRELYNCMKNKLPGYVCNNDDELLILLSSTIDGNVHKNERSDLLKLITSNNEDLFIINKIKKRISI